MITFREWLKNQLTNKGIRAAALARKSGVSPQNLSRILTDKPHPITGAPPTVTRETVVVIAKALGADLDEALHAAGYATTSPTKPQTLSELITALENLGLDMPLMYDDLPDDPEAFKETLERIYLDVKLVIERTLTRSQERRLNDIQNKLANPPTRKLDTSIQIR
jgi:transcriptional regulator with XRE-family HTH domain